MPPAAVPAHAALLRDFANTVDISDDVDELTTPGGLTAWLRGRHLLTTGATADATDLAVSRDLREAVRSALRAHHDDLGEPSPAALGDLAHRLPMGLELAADQPRLVPLERGVRGALTRVLVAAVDAGADGSWRRLKICPADDCAYAFFDTSKNRSKTWCSMQVCGNRMKTRSYRARKASAG